MNTNSFPDSMGTAPGAAAGGHSRGNASSHADELRCLARDSLGSQPLVPAMALALAGNFGSVDAWREAFASLGVGAAGAECWAVLAFRQGEGTLVNCVATEASPLPAGTTPIAAVRVEPREDASAILAAIDDIDWSRVYLRYQDAVNQASEAFGVERDEVGDAVLVDVRRAGVFEKAATMLPEASWQDPALVADWARELPKDREVVVYCIYGHEVGRSTAMRLRAAGVNARYLRGGIDGWQSAGLEVVPKSG